MLIFNPNSPADSINRLSNGSLATFHRGEAVRLYTVRTIVMTHGTNVAQLFTAETADTRKSFRYRCETQPRQSADD